MIYNIRLQLGKKLHLVRQRCERVGVFGMKTEYYLPATAAYVIGMIVIVGRIYLFFLSVIEDVHVLLITGLSYSFTLFFSRNSSFSVIHSIYFITHIILNCHRQWLVYKQKNINTHGSAKIDFYKNTRRNF